MTDFFWRGQIFHLQDEDVVLSNSIIGNISPLQVQRTDAFSVLKALKLEFVHVPAGAQAYLFKPSEKVAYVLISDLPDLWSAKHVSSTQELLNKSFTF